MPVSATLTSACLAEVARGHWGIENRLHLVLDVIFKEDLSRLRRGHGVRNMAVVCLFTINLVRLEKGTRPVKTMHKVVGWNPDELNRVLSPNPR